MKIDAYKLTEKLFGASPAIKDCGKALRLYEDYKKLETKPKVKQQVKDKKLEELKETLKDAHQGINRLYNIYEKSYEEMKSQEITLTYNNDERKSYFQKLKELHNEINGKYKEFFNEGENAKENASA